MTNNKSRYTSYGQNSNFSLIDRFGIYLSEVMIKKCIKKLGENNIELLDLGCGYHAVILKNLVPIITKGVGVDLAVHEDVKLIPNLQFVEQKIEEVFTNFQNDTFHIILMNSVLEHLWDPLFVLSECKRILRKNGVLLINVPTWRGKFFLETSAFVFKLSPEIEIDDHKMYYDKKDLWPILVKSGFKPSSIKMTYHKFGLNLFSTCINKG